MEAADEARSRTNAVRRWAPRVAFALVAGLVLWSSFVTVENGKRGVVQRFGRPVREILPGFHLKLPWPMENVRHVAGPERSQQMPIGFRLIEEHMGISPSPRQKEWLTGDNNIVEIKANLLYGIRDARQFLYGVSGVNDRDRDVVEPADFALRRLAESALTELVGRTEVDDVLTAASIDIAREARDRIQAEADMLGLGIEVQTLQILDIGPLASVERDFREVQDAKSRAATEITVAESNRDQLTMRARNRARGWLQEARADHERAVRQAETRVNEFESIRGAIGAIDTPAGRRMVYDRLRGVVEKMDVQVSPPGTAERPRVVYVGQ